MKNLLLASLCFYLVGCATADWNSFMYGNPNGQAQTYGFHCDNCNRVFNGTIDAGQSVAEYINCPYCGIKLNSKLANNRFLYNQQQQQQAASQSYWQQNQAYWHEKAQQSHQEVQNLLKQRANQSKRTLTTTNCDPQIGGGFRCTSY